ncbi:MAG: 30S ribosomal protein S6 [Pseudomonadota bacterium]
MRRYETVMIVPVDLPDDEITGSIDRYRSIITNHKGLVIKVEKWGKRKLAYEIKKHNKGFYMLVDFAGQSATVAELERNLKIDDQILKFMTVKKDDHVILEDIEREIAAGSPAVAATETEIKIIENSASSLTQAIEPDETKTAEVQEGGA